MKLHRLTARLVVGAMLTLPAWVHAAGLGKLTIKSALGQPLSAEIELLVTDKSELDSLNATLASSQAYKDAQIEFAPVLSTLQFSIEKSASGSAVLKLSSSKPVNDPFLDMLVELNWASGRLMREYTMLLDPPGVAVPQTVAPVAISVPETKPEQPPKAQDAKAPEPKAPETSPKPGVPKLVTVDGVPPGPAATKPSSAQQEAKSAPAAATQESSVQVKRGDTLVGIANRVRPASVSLEQALVSLYHENAEAFQGKNMNRLKAGAELKVPTAEQMAEQDDKAARREINLQAADWQAYRAKLAASVAQQPGQEKETAGKTAVGKVTPKVEDKAQPSKDAAKDVLKLSKSAPDAQSAQSTAEKAAQKKALAAQKAQEDKTAREKAVKESNERAAELEKQIQDMKKLAKLKEEQAASAALGAKEMPPADAPKAKKKPPIVFEEPQTTWYDELIENPIYWVGGLSIIVLGGLLWWMVAGGRLRKKKLPEVTTDNIITGGDLQPSGTAGAAATGGVVNTGDTSFLTDFSQAGLAEIDTHDVDPIAEADVYMAYGRDAQAEEILKEALIKTPERHEIRLKLLEIYAARKNVTSFEAVAGELYAALGGQTGTVWEKAVEMGRSIDPQNPLYGGNGKTQSAPAAASAPAAVTPQAAKAAPTPPPAPARDSSMAAPEAPAQEIELNFPALDEEVKSEAPAAAKETKDQSLDFDLSGFELDIPAPPAAPQTAAASETAKPGGMDFSGLDLDLSDVGEEGALDEAATKLDLAKAYLEMGDKEGAREILQEVISEGNEQQKSDARNIMAGL